MADFTKLSTSLDFVSKLPDRPSYAEGYTAEKVKNTFDRAGSEIQSYINGTLLAELSSSVPGDSASEKIGARPIAGVNGNTVFAQLSHIAAMISDAVAGTIPDNTVTAEKLHVSLRDKIDLVSLKEQVFTLPGQYTFVCPRTGDYLVTLCGGGAAGSMASPDQETPDLTHYGFGGASGAYLEAKVHLEAGDTVAVKVGKGGVAAPPVAVGEVFFATHLYNTEARGESSSFGDLSAGGGMGYEPTRPGGGVLGEGITFSRLGRAQPSLYPTHDGLDSHIGNGGRRVLGVESDSLCTPAGVGGGGYGYIYSDAPYNGGLANFDDRKYYLNKTAGDGGDGYVSVRYLDV